MSTSPDGTSIWGPVVSYFLDAHGPSVTGGPSALSLRAGRHPEQPHHGRELTRLHPAGSLRCLSLPSHHWLSPQGERVTQGTPGDVQRQSLMGEQKGAAGI